MMGEIVATADTSGEVFVVEPLDRSVFALPSAQQSVAEKGAMVKRAGKDRLDPS